MTNESQVISSISYQDIDKLCEVFLPASFYFPSYKEDEILQLQLAFTQGATVLLNTIKNRIEDLQKVDVPNTDKEDEMWDKAKKILFVQTDIPPVFVQVCINALKDNFKISKL